MGAGMSDAAMRDAMVRMATDTEFARRVRDEGPEVARQYGLSETELASLQALHQADASSGPQQMVQRLSKSGLFGMGALSAMSDLGAAALHAGPAPDVHGLLCDGHSLLCNGHSFVCNEHSLLCDGHSFVCNEHGHAHAGVVRCNGHAEVGVFKCNAHAGVVKCNAHTEIGVFKCNAHAGVVKCNAHIEGGIKCNLHADSAKGVDHEVAAIQCNGHAAGLTGDAALKPPVVGLSGVHSLLQPPAGGAGAPAS
jgi:hypothetical protein